MANSVGPPRTGAVVAASSEEEPGPAVMQASDQEMMGWTDRCPRWDSNPQAREGGGF